MAVTLGDRIGARAERTVHSHHGERREWPRYNLSVGPKIELHADGRRFSCRLRDISLGGARLSAEGLPVLVESTVKLDHPAGGRCTVARSWRRGDELGVAFDFSPECLALITHFVRQQVAVAEPTRASAG